MDVISQPALIHFVIDWFITSSLISRSQAQRSSTTTSPYALLHLSLLNFFKVLRQFHDQDSMDLTFQHPIHHRLASCALQHIAHPAHDPHHPVFPVATTCEHRHLSSSALRFVTMVSTATHTRHGFFTSAFLSFPFPATNDVRHPSCLSMQQAHGAPLSS